jgi:adenine/guanine phosphoribosyltransferase-like PRPP-binding protein
VAITRCEGGHTVEVGGMARRFGHARYVPLGVSRKFWYDDALSVPLKSITTPGGAKRLYLDPRMRPLLTGRVAVVDDVLSSGSSIAAVLSLLELVGVTPIVIGAAMLQGEGWRNHVRGLPVRGAIATPILPPIGAA